MWITLYFSAEDHNWVMDLCGERQMHHLSHSTSATAAGKHTGHLGTTEQQALALRERKSSWGSKYSSFEHFVIQKMPPTHSYEYRRCNLLTPMSTAFQSQEIPFSQLTAARPFSLCSPSAWWAAVNHSPARAGLRCAPGHDLCLFVSPTLHTRALLKSGLGTVHPSGTQGLSPQQGRENSPTWCLLFPPWHQTWILWAPGSCWRVNPQLSFPLAV